MSWYGAILTRTAELKLMVNFHGAEMPRGMQRTWPHVMTAEGIFGAEQKQNRAAFNTMLPYTRNALSSMDFTPVTLCVTNRDTTDAHEAATGLVFESGWQHDADSPESYESRPDVIRALDQLPAVWDETRLLGGTPRREAYLARRNADRWFIGGISAIAAKTYQTPLSFLGTGQWFADILRDRSGGGVTRETRIVSSTDTLSVPMATNGGFVAIVWRYTSGMTQCPRTSGPSNVALGKPAAGSAACNSSEIPAKAFNGSVSGGNSDKFCSGAATKFLQVDLGQSYPITSFTIRHAGAGGEYTGWNTRDYDILVSPDGTNWTSIIQARGNTANVTTQTITTTARYARLNIIAAEQGAGGATRLYEFEIYS